MERRNLLNRNGLIAVLLCTANALFVLKYSTRFGVLYGLCSIPYFIFFTTVIVLVQRRDTGRIKPLNRTSFIVIIAAILFGELAVQYLNPAQFRVGRLPALIDWISSLEAGKFPYHTSTIPSGFPFLFVLAYPWYLLKNIGLLAVLGTVLFGLLVFNWSGKRDAWLQTVAFLLSPAIFYEVLVRSELFFNMVLVLALLVLSERFLSRKMDWLFLGIAALFGLFLSTRSIVGLVYVVYVVYRFKNAWKHGIVFSSVTLCVFVLTLVPFVVWNPDLFFLRGPFSVQFAHTSLWIVGILVGAAAFAGWRAENMSDVLFHCGLCLFVVVALSCLARIMTIGLAASLLESGFDLAYFLLCFPFLLLSLKGHHDLTELGVVDR